MLVFVFRELDDKNRVLGRQADQHHQSDLRVNVAFDLRGAVLVEAHGELRAWTRLKSGQRGKRHHLIFVVAYEKLPDILSPRAVVAFGLDVNLPLSPEAIEVIDEKPTHECLDGLI